MQPLRAFLPKGEISEVPVGVKCDNIAREPAFFAPTSPRLQALSAEDMSRQRRRSRN